MAIVRRTEPSALSRGARGWDPFQSMRELLSWDPFQEMVPGFYGSSERGATFVPAFDVRDIGEAYVFQADMPGFKEGDVEIQMVGNRLTISGKREIDAKEEGETYYCAERSYGDFSRSFTLPSDVDADHAEAHLADGVLTLRVPKTPAAQPRRIEIRAAGSEEEQIPQVSSGSGPEATA